MSVAGVAGFDVVASVIVGIIFGVVCCVFSSFVVGSRIVVPVVVSRSVVSAVAERWFADKVHSSCSCRCWRGCVVGFVVVFGFCVVVVVDGG